MSFVPDVRGTEHDGRLHQQELEVKAARHELAVEAKRDRHEGDRKRQTLLSRLLARFRGSAS